MCIQLKNNIAKNRILQISSGIHRGLKTKPALFTGFQTPNPPKHDGKANNWRSAADTSTPNNAGKKQEKKQYSNSASKRPHLGVTRIRKATHIVRI